METSIPRVQQTAMQDDLCHQNIAAATHLQEQALVHYLPKNNYHDFS